MIYNDTHNNIFNEISYLKEEIKKLENRVFNMRSMLIQVAINTGWTNEEINNVICTFDGELEYFRNNI